MRFERILENGKLWAVVYDGDNVNALEKVFTQWNDYEWLREFFTLHFDDLASFFHITNIDRAIFDTVDEANDLECLIMDIEPDANLDKLFRPLENTRISEVLLGREKAKGRGLTHSSWLRLYAIRHFPCLSSTRNAPHGERRRNGGGRIVAGSGTRASLP